MCIYFKFDVCGVDDGFFGGNTLVWRSVVEVEEWKLGYEEIIKSIKDEQKLMFMTSWTQVLSMRR